MITHREHQILLLYAQGLSAKLIAQDLCIAEQTVISHKKSIMQKLDTSNIAHTIHVAHQRQIIQSHPLQID